MGLESAHTVGYRVTLSTYPQILHQRFYTKKKDLEIPSQGLSGPASNFIVVSCISGVVVLGEVSVDAGVLTLTCNIKSLFGRGPQLG